MGNRRDSVVDELRRLRTRPTRDQKPGGIGVVRFTVRCPVGASDVLQRATDVLTIVDEVALSGWLSDAEWKTRLPGWFTSVCAPQLTQEQAERWLKWWRSLTPEQQTQSEIEKDWSLENWLYWMEPENRQWFWWDAEAIEECDHIIAAIEVDAWPFPWGAFRWLFKTAGASAVTPEE